MNWTNTDFSADEEQNDGQDQSFRTHRNSLEIQNQKDLQLSKYRSAFNDVKRQTYMKIMAQFGHLLVNQSLEEISKSILHENCTYFLFNLHKDKPMVSSIEEKCLSDLYKTVKIRARRVLETHVDTERQTAFQICKCQVSFPLEDQIIDLMTCEAFNFDDSNKVLRYIANFGHITPLHGLGEPIQPTPKDKMLAKVKEINCALAGNRPDLARLSGLFHANTEYRFWNWDNSKCYAFNKNTLVKNFRDIEEDFSLECIVPYGIYSETHERSQSPYIVGTYIYHLKTKEMEPKKYLWMSTAIFSFDEDLNVSKIIQQGELYAEEEAETTFEALTREDLVKRAPDELQFTQYGIGLFYVHDIEFSFAVSTFAAESFPILGTYTGVKELDGLKDILRRVNEGFEFEKMMDIYVDFNGVDYDTVVVVNLNHGVINQEGHELKGKQRNVFNILTYSFENGKLVRLYQFPCEIPDEAVFSIVAHAFGDIKTKS